MGLFSSLSSWNDKGNSLAGKGGVAEPQMSAEENRLLTLITKNVEDQQAYNEQMMPIYAHSMHMKIEQESYTDPTTKQTKTRDKWVQMSDEEWMNDPNTTDSEKKSWEIQTASQDRQLKALKGELPLTQTMTDQKQKEFEQLKATFGTISGNNVDEAKASDTIAVQNLSEFKKRWGILEENQRYGEITTGQANTTAAAGLTTDLASNKIGTLANIGNANAGVNSQYGSLLQPYMAYTQAGYQAQAQNQATNAQRYGSLLSTGGMIGAAAIMSSKKFKKDIKSKSQKDENKALKDLKSMKSYEYKYKNKMGLGTEKHIGTIAEESPRSITNSNKTAINLGDKIELMSMSIKALARKMDKMEARA